MKMLVIGYGNELRGDDAVGVRVARAVAAWARPKVEAIAAQGLAPEMAERIAGADVVVFVDASQGSAGMTELHAEDVLPLGHTSEPGWLLALARAVYGRQPRAWLLAIAATRFEFGEPLSAVAERGMQQALAWIQELAERSACKLLDD